MPYPEHQSILDQMVARKVKGDVFARSAILCEELSLLTTKPVVTWIIYGESQLIWNVIFSDLFLEFVYMACI